MTRRPLPHQLLPMPMGLVDYVDGFLGVVMTVPVKEGILFLPIIDLDVLEPILDDVIDSRFTGLDVLEGVDLMSIN